MATTSSVTAPKESKTEVNKNKDIKPEKVDKVINVRTEKTTEIAKTEKPVVNSHATPVSASIKTEESKTKQNTSPNATNNKNQSVTSNKNQELKEEKNLSVVKSTAEQVTKAPTAKATRTSKSSLPAPSPIEGRVKRNRFKTIPYQSPTPEFELVSKISANEAINAHKKKVEEDKLTLFYKNEFLAVRNAEGGFFLCQAINNVYKSSPKIRIRWLSEEASNKNIYCLDFLDWTDIECVLTSVSLNKLAKSKFELEQAESDRIVNILKKALAVEKGIVERSDLTEDNPDGLDLSLYKDESQIEKKAPGKRRAGGSAKGIAPAAKKQKLNTATPAAKVKPNEKANKFVDSSKKIVDETPTSKRSTTRRKLMDEVQDGEGVTKKGSESSEPEAKVSKSKPVTRHQTH